MLARLHPDQDAGEFERDIETFTSLEQPYICFLAFTSDNHPIGMIDARVRNYAESAPRLSAAYVEDLWVDPEHRRGGVATALVRAIEQWALNEGHDWLGSDTELANEPSQQWHAAAGFAEVERLVVFGKPLD